MPIVWMPTVMFECEDTNVVGQDPIVNSVRKARHEINVEPSPRSHSIVLEIRR